MKFENFQFAIFAGSLSGYNAASAWGLLTDAAFQTFNTNPANPLMTSASGVIQNFAVEVQVQPGRLDIFLRNPDGLPFNAPSALPPLLDDMSTATAMGEYLIGKLSVLPMIQRLAIVARGIEEFEGSEAIANRLRQLIPGLPSPVGARDHSYQINVPGLIGSDKSIPVNRLCRWSASQRSIMILQIAPDGTQQPAPAGPISWTADTYVDVFSTAMATPLASAQVVSFIQAIGAEVRRIVRDGYPALGQ